MEIWRDVDPRKLIWIPQNDVEKVTPASNVAILGISSNFRDVTDVTQKNIHPRKLTWNLKMMISTRYLLFQEAPIFRFKMLVFGGCKTEAQLIMALHTFCLEPYAIWEAHSKSAQSWRGVKLRICKTSPTGATLAGPLNLSTPPKVNSSPLNNDRLKTTFVLGRPIPRGYVLNLGI